LSGTVDESVLREQQVSGSAFVPLGGTMQDKTDDKKPAVLVLSWVKQVVPTCFNFGLRMKYALGSYIINQE